MIAEGTSAARRAQATLRVAVLGAGRMGSALVRTFRQRGHDTAVWNRTLERAQPLAQSGAHVAPSVREAVAAADLIVGIVNDYPASERMLLAPGVAEALRGKLLVQLAAGSPRHARELCTWAQTS